MPITSGWGLERGQRYEVIAVDTQQKCLNLGEPEQGSCHPRLIAARIRKKSVFEVEDIELAVGESAALDSQ